jgi:predicted phage terminase large subunit-like protein
VDAAFKGNENNDYVAITVWGKAGNDYYLRYCLRRHLDFPGTVAAIRAVRGLYPDATAVLIEDKANGSAIIQTLQAECFCIPVNPMGGKEARVHAVSPAIESGHVYIPETAPWLEEYLDEWSVFPAGAHDDMVDSSTQALSYLLRFSGYTAPQRTEDEQRILDSAQREEEYYLADDVFNPYGGNEYGY